MKQKKLSVIVCDRNGTELYRRDPAHPQEIVPILQLFDSVGTSIGILIEEFEIPEKGLS